MSIIKVVELLNHHLDDRRFIIGKGNDAIGSFLRRFALALKALRVWTDMNTLKECRHWKKQAG
jgi:hypothetical protein